MLYQPTCEHCRAEFTAIEHGIARTRGSRLLFLTPHPRTRPDSMAQRWPRLSTASNVEWGRARLRDLQRSFGIKVVPTAFVFDSTGKLTATYHGEVKLDLLFPPG